MHNNDEWLIVGCFGRAHGVKGFITIHSFTDPRDKIIAYSDWHSNINKHLILLKPFEITVRDKLIIARVDSYATREDVEMLTNQHILIRAEQLPKLSEGEYYWAQLIGLSVVNHQEQFLGVVSEIMPTGSNDVLVVQGDKRYLIPYLPGDFVLDINLAQKQMLVMWDIDF